jgi:hypothetical protein
MPPDQRSDDAPTIGESTGQFGFWEMDLRDMALTLSDATCAIYGLGPHAALRTGARLDVGYRIVRPKASKRWTSATSCSSTAATPIGAAARQCAATSAWRWSPRG